MMSKPMGALFGVLTLVAILAIAPSAFAQESGTTVNISAGAGSSPNCSQANNCFDPDVINVATGTTVEWKNNDKVSHTVTSGSPSDNQTGTIFDSSLIASGKDFSFTFNTPGTYSYFCQVHPWMTGQVIVGGAAATTSNSTSSTTPTTPSTAPSMNMSSPMSGTNMSSTTSSNQSSTTPTTSSTAPSMNMSSPMSGTNMSSTQSSNQSSSTTPTTNTQPTPTSAQPAPAPAQPSETSSTLAPPASTQSTSSTDPGQMSGWATGMAVAAILSGVGIWTAVRRR